MTRHEKTLQRVIAAIGVQSVRFGDLCGLLHHLGFDERVSGSHHIFSRPDLPEIVNIQPRKDGTAKPYQVRQLRMLILRHKMVRLDQEDS